MRVFAALTILLILFQSCESATKTNEKSTFVTEYLTLTVDSTITNAAKNDIFSIEPSGYYFATHLKKEIYSNDTLAEKIDSLQKNIYSYYTWKSDTLLIVAHTDSATNNAMLVKIYGSTVATFFLKCNQTNPSYKLSPQGLNSNCIEVPGREHGLIISAMPDSIRKQPIYGHFSLTSNDYYYTKNVGEDSDRQNAKMELYFRANYKKS